MTELILHHYPESPFSEKIRLLLGYKQCAWQSVIIPVIMPKPDLTVLTGGYRKTPVLQAGADIYCDTALIARFLDRLPGPGIYPAEAAAVETLAQWTDSSFFRVAVALSFQPRALEGSALLRDEESMARFIEDRAKLTKGSSALQLPLDLATDEFLVHLRRLEAQLADGRAFLFGSQPTIADFSTYHCIWFVYNNEVLRELFKSCNRLLAWRQRMADLGHGSPQALSSSEAVELAKQATPAALSEQGPPAADAIPLGTEVEVEPTDYGIDPVRGLLRASSLHELVVQREDPMVGDLLVHFPRLGFRVRRVDEPGAADHR